MDQVIFTHLQNLLNPQLPEYQSSYEFINNMKNSDVNHFLQILIFFYQNVQLPFPIRQLCLILCYQIFPQSLNGVKDHPFSNFTTEIIESLLNTSLACFNDEVLQIRISSANLFSRIACIDILTNDQFGIIAKLIQGFQNPQSEFSFEALCLTPRRFVRLRQTGENCFGDHFLNLANIEFSGFLYE